jgi:hypothetical protein
MKAERNWQTGRGGGGETAVTYIGNPGTTFVHIGIVSLSLCLFSPFQMIKCKKFSLLAWLELFLKEYV